MPAGSTYTPLASTTLGSAQSTVTFSSISSAYTDLVLVIQGGNSGGTNFDFAFNSDTSSGLYSSTRLQGNGSAASSDRFTGQNDIIGPQVSNNLYSNVIAHFQNYSNSTTYKTVLMRGNDAGGVVNAYVGLWRNTNAINSIMVRTYTNAYTINAGSTFTLYGIASA